MDCQCGCGEKGICLPHKSGTQVEWLLPTHYVELFGVKPLVQLAIGIAALVTLGVWSGLQTKPRR